MRISVNREPLKRLGRLLYMWMCYVALALILGFSLHPRPDEILFVSTLPLWVLVPYALFCLVGACIKSWLIRFQRWPIGLGLIRNHRIQARGSARNDRFAK